MPGSNWSKDKFLGQLPSDISFLLKWILLSQDMKNQAAEEVTKWSNLLHELGEEQLADKISDFFLEFDGLLEMVKIRKIHNEYFNKKIPTNCVSEHCTCKKNYSNFLNTISQLSIKILEELYIHAILPDLEYVF